MEPKLISLKGVSVTALKIIHHPKGDVLHALKCSEDSFEGFGEAYFTTVYKDELKGWKQHIRMTMNLVVPVGEVGFHFHNQELSKSVFLRVGQSNYVRITVQPGIWMAFQGLAADLNLVLNIGSIPHDPTEAINSSIASFPLGKVNGPE